jgi:LPXTG-motif cell wall-anchored protein
MMTVVASAAGPLLLARTLARTGSYELIFFALSGLVALLGVTSWFVRTPQRKSVHSEGSL